LTRVALREGSLVVNSSQGGGSKDTWVLGSWGWVGYNLQATRFKLNGVLINKFVNNQRQNTQPVTKKRMFDKNKPSVKVMNSLQPVACGQIKNKC
jgi:hypothetical protein